MKNFKILSLFCLFIILTMSLSYAESSLTDTLPTEDYKSDKIAGVGLGDTKSIVIDALGEPEEKSSPGNDAIYEEAISQYFKYKSKGIAIWFLKDADGNWKVSNISMQSPCKLGTLYGVKIGDSNKKVSETYIIREAKRGSMGNIINKDYKKWVNTSVCCGGYYDGLMFTFDKNGKVKKIVLGIIND
jgi:hypothetical protein